MHRHVFKFFLFLFLCSLTSCFDIIDEINLNSDGSGDMTLTLNLSKSKTKIASIMLMDSINGHKVPSKQDIREGITKAVNMLKNTEGISGVTNREDFDNYVFSISFQFRSVEKLNKVINKYREKQKVKPLITSYHFNKSSNIFSRRYTYNKEVKKQYNKLKSKDKKVFDGATYTSIFRFQDEVKNYTNQNMRLSKSKKALMLRTPALDLINGKINLSNKIQLK